MDFSVSKTVRSQVMTPSRNN